MIKVFSLLAAGLCAWALAPAVGARGAAHPLELTLGPAPAVSLATPDNENAFALAPGLAPASAASSPLASIPEQPPKLSIDSPKHLRLAYHFLVGQDAARLMGMDAGHIWQARPAMDLRPEWDFIQHQVVGPSNLERVADLLDIDEQERPWATTTTVHLLAPGDKGLLPFATLAHEVDADEDFERFGMGAGTMFVIDKNTSLGAEVIYYGSDHPNSNSGFARETQFMARLQIAF